MSERIWDKFLTERDKTVFAAGGFGARAGFGKRPALLVIDVNWAFCGERPEPILELIKRWRTSCGEEAWAALEHIKPLIEAARAKGLPVIYTTGERRPDNWDAGSWRWKSSRANEAASTVHAGVDGNEIVSMIAPGPKDIVIKKQKPSGFFGTNLASFLTLLGCDSVIIVGTTTSGCVRATVVDAFSLNYRVILAERAVSTAARPATPSACAICRPNTPTSSQRPKSSRISISCLTICSTSPRAILVPQPRSERRPNRDPRLTGYSAAYSRQPNVALGYADGQSGAPRPVLRRWCRAAVRAGHQRREWRPACVRRVLWPKRCSPTAWPNGLSALKAHSNGKRERLHALFGGRLLPTPLDQK